MIQSMCPVRRVRLTGYLLVGVLLACAAGPTQAKTSHSANVDDTDQATLVDSAIRAFDRYLQIIDAGDLDRARTHTFDPGFAEGRLRVAEKLLAFIRGRMSSSIRNEGLVVRVQGDWALVVYQYDTTIEDQTTRVITTAWMLQWEDTWKQFIIAPNDPHFWDTRQADHDALQSWFDQHAREIAGQS